MKKFFSKEDLLALVADFNRLSDFNIDENIIDENKYPTIRYDSLDGSKNLGIFINNAIKKLLKIE